MNPKEIQTKIEKKLDRIDTELVYAVESVWMRTVEDLDKDSEEWLADFLIKELTKQKDEEDGLYPAVAQLLDQLKEKYEKD